MTIASALRAQHGADTRAFVAALIGKMTLREKLGQLTLYSAAQDVEADPFNPVFFPITDVDRLADIRSGAVGGFFNTVGVSRLRDLQKIAVEESRLGIPLVFAADVVHGFKTIFPVPLAEMASWDPDLACRTARAAAAEASSAGIDWTFAPGMDVARDARWGRMVESSGEDALLASRFAAARVHGYQQGALDDPSAIMATAKHFAGYGAAEAGLDYNTADLSWRTLREHYLPPFEAAVGAGVGAVMTAFNDLEGVPCTANRRLLDDILRQAWRFDGIVISDYTSDFEMIAHGHAAGPREAALLSLRAGLDVSLESGLFVAHGEALVASGAVPESIVDAAVTRMLRAKLTLGLFDDPYRRLSADRHEAERPMHRALAREAAASSAVLLKNDGVLPLRTGIRIAAIGPLADDATNLNGCWSLFGSSTDSTTLKEALQARLGGDSVIYAQGCGLADALPGGIEDACAAADSADAVVLAIGEGERWSGEARSRAEFDLPAAQLDLLRALHARGKQIVAVISTGRPLPLTLLEPYCDAILIGWFLGSESGNGLSDLLVGARAPRARLPVSFPRHAGQVPIYYSRKATGRPFRQDREPFRASYQDVAPTPLYPFGFGLTYTSFKIGAPKASAPTLAIGRPIRIGASVSNTGARDGDLLVQLYVRDLAASVVRPMRELKDFRWVHVLAGETVTVEFTLDATQLRFWNQMEEHVNEPGEYEIWIGDHAEGGSSTLVTLATECETTGDTAQVAEIGTDN